jgi:uncharacterized glyoxalase superfamily protein PhnB
MMIFRYARHTGNLENLIKFYTEVLGFQILGKFKNHSTYNGVFLGFQDAGWHLEFTESDKPAQHTFDEDDILVFYPKTAQEYNQLKERLKSVKEMVPKNPYWKGNGIMITDPDGYRIVISPEKLLKRIIK